MYQEGSGKMTQQIDFFHHLFNQLNNNSNKDFNQNHPKFVTIKMVTFIKLTIAIVIQVIVIGFYLKNWTLYTLILIELSY